MSRSICVWIFAIRIDTFCIQFVRDVFPPLPALIACALRDKSGHHIIIATSHSHTMCLAVIYIVSRIESATKSLLSLSINILTFFSLAVFQRKMMTTYEHNICICGKKIMWWVNYNMMKYQRSRRAKLINHWNYHHTKHVLAEDLFTFISSAYIHAAAIISSWYDFDSVYFGSIIREELFNPSHHV